MIQTLSQAPEVKKNNLRKKMTLLTEQL